jgi:hypothetical protein
MHSGRGKARVIVRVEERAYILQYRPEGSTEFEYLPVTRFDIESYRCGLKAGDCLRLIRDLPILGEDGKPTGRHYPKEGIWIVLTGSSQDPDALWLRQPDGQLYSWDDDPEIFDSFEIAPVDD